MREAWSLVESGKIFLAERTACSRALRRRLPAIESTAVRPLSGDKEGRGSERRGKLDLGHRVLLSPAGWHFLPAH